MTKEEITLWQQRNFTFIVLIYWIVRERYVIIKKLQKY